MLEKIIAWLKGALASMFNKNQMRNISGQEPAITSIMLSRMNLYEEMLKGRAPWLDPVKGINSLHLESAICREFANVALSEMETSIKNAKLNEIYQRAVNSLNSEFQNALGMGSFVIKPLGNTGKFEFIRADQIIPLEYDSEKRLTRCAFVGQKIINDNMVYYRLETHELINNRLHISNRAFKGNTASIGVSIPLSEIEEWASLPEDIIYPFNRIDFGYYRNPIPNRVDGSNNPVSVFEDAIKQIESADRQFSRLDWEYESGERMVFGDYQIFKKEEKGNGYRFKVPEGKARMFVGLDIDGDNGDPIREHSPGLRDQNYISGLNEYKRQVEFNVSLAYGDLSKNEAIEKTATEIVASKNRKYNMVNAIQTNLKSCLKDFAYALAFYMAQYSEDIGFECNFHDSIKTDEEAERAQDRLDMATGILSKVEYRMKWYGEDEKTAREKIEAVIIDEVSDVLS